MQDHRKRQKSNLRQRYDAVVLGIRDRWPPGAVVPETAVRTLMDGLDVHMSDYRTQDKNLGRLCSGSVFGDAVLERVSRDMYRVLPRKQMTIEDRCRIVELMQK